MTGNEIFWLTMECGAAICGVFYTGGPRPLAAAAVGDGETQPCCCYRHLSAKSADSRHPHCPVHGDGKPHDHFGGGSGDRQ